MATCRVCRGTVYRTERGRIVDHRPSLESLGGGGYLHHPDQVTRDAARRTKCPGSGQPPLKPSGGA